MKFVRLNRKYSKALIAISVAFLLVVADYFVQNISYPLLDDVETFQWEQYLSHEVEPDFDDGVMYVNVGLDKQLVDIKQEVEDWDGVRLDTIGNAVITDRSKLLTFLQSVRGSDYRYIFLDVRFEQNMHTPVDSALFATILSMRDIVIATHNGEDYVIADSALLAKAAIADYHSTFQSGFTRYEFLQQEQPSVALRMYEDMSRHVFGHRWGLYFDNGHLCYNLCFIPIPSQLSLHSHDAQDWNNCASVQYSGYSTLGHEILAAQSILSPEEIQDSYRGKIIIIGDFENDVHTTYVGEVPGPLLSLLGWRYLMAGKHLVSFWYLLAIYVLYFLLTICYLYRFTVTGYVKARCSHLANRWWYWGVYIVLRLLSLGFVLLLIKILLFRYTETSLLLTLPMLVLSLISFMVDARERVQKTPRKVSKKTAVVVLLMVCSLSSWADNYKVLRIKPGSVITIDGQRATVDMKFRDDARIRWGSMDDAMEAMNLSSYRKFYFSARQFKSGNMVDNVCQFLLRTNKTSTRGEGSFSMVVTPCQSGKVPQKRIALVMGNGAYRSYPTLLNPGRDVAAISRKLLTLGFDVVECYDYDRDQMNTVIRQFTSAARVYDVALVYYAGHGIQLSGHNYLVPVGCTNVTSPTADMLVSCDHLTAELSATGCSVQMLWLDACRSLQGNSTQGLGYMEGGNVTIIFSTAHGQVAYDAGESTAVNSPFATAFLEQVDKPGVKLAELVRNISARTAQLTASRQHPTMSGIPTDFSFRPAVSVTQTTTTTATTPTAAPVVANSGNLATLYNMAHRYRDGDGVAADPVQAFHYMKAAAEGGYAPAFRELGEMYHGGRGVKKDRETAAFWYRKAAKNGDKKAQRLLDNML